MQKIIRFLADQPIIFDILRRVIEANYISLKRVIRKEFSFNIKKEKGSSHGRILDVPCGTGEFCMLFSPDHYLGLDISEKYIDYAREKYNHTFICGDASKTGLEPTHFDKILMLGFLHHLDDGMVTAVLNEAKRILKPDGVLLLIEDAPTKSKFNIIGKMLQRLDVGSNIRPAYVYGNFLKEDFAVVRYYHVRSGFWDYSVFVLTPHN